MSLLYYIDDTLLVEMKNAIDKNLHLYRQDKPWCEDLLEVDISKLTKPAELKLPDSSDRASRDLENTIILYDSLKDLPYSVASDEKYWAFLTHTVYWEYMRKRWPIEDSQQNDVEFIKGRYFFSSKSKNFYRSGLSRLWWYAAVTYDENNYENPYYYTELMLSRKDIASLIMDSPTVARNKVATFAFLSCIEKLNKLEENQEIEKIKGREAFIRTIMKKLNYIGAITIWDALDKDEAMNLLWKVIEKDLIYKKQKDNQDIIYFSFEEVK